MSSEEALQVENVPAEIQAETLLQLAADRRVRQSKGFREVAELLTGKQLASLYAKQRERAPRRVSEGKKYFAKHSARLGKKTEEHALRALVNLGLEKERRVSGDLSVRLVDWGVPLASASPVKGDSKDPNFRVGKLDLLAAGSDGRLLVSSFKFLDSSATRGTTGDTPLRALLEALAASAIVSANIEDFRSELEENFSISADPNSPAVAIIASPRYWELCRKREAQKGARWIKELERLAAEFTEESGIPVYYLSLKLRGEPWLEIDTEGPKLVHEPDFGQAWEPRAGVVKVKSAPRARSASVAESVIDADLDRPIRSYATSEEYLPGDRIDHLKLGIGVVQAVAGPEKIRVRFEEEDKILVHRRIKSGLSA